MSTNKTTAFLDKPGKKKLTTGRQMPSIMDRIRDRRRRGAYEVAIYVVRRRNEILKLLRKEPERLTREEWRIVNREIHKLNKKEKEKAKEMEAREAKLAERREEEERRKAAEREEHARKFAVILASEDIGGPAARSKFTLEELYHAGVRKAHYDRASDLRRSALKLTAAAEYLDIPKSRLDTWCREGVVQPSFTRRMQVDGAGVVDARHFIPSDLDALDLDAIEARRKELRKKAKAEANA